MTRTMYRALLIFISVFLLSPLNAFAGPPRILKFQGVPLSLGSQLKKKFPFVFEREVTLTEVDDVVRFLMKSGNFSSIEVVERDVDGEEQEGPSRELVLVASILRHVQDIQLKGNKIVSSQDVLRTLNVAPGQPFERKNLVAAAEDLRKAYERLGYHNAKVEIEFDLPNEKEVLVIANIIEGLPIKVSETIIDSPNPVLNSRLLRTSRKLKDKILTEELLLDFQRQAVEYFHDNRFLTARLTQPTISTNVEKTLAKVTYGIENPWYFEFRMEGNKFFSDGAITRHLESEKLSGATSSPAPDMAERVRRLYEQAGFANVEVTYTEDRNDTSYRHLIAFKIVENPRVRIKKIEITGNVSRPEAYYTQFIKSSSSDLIGDGFYNRKDIEDGAKALIVELQNQGFLRAKIQSQRAEFSKDKRTATISFNIDEGPLTQVRQIRFEGVEAFTRAQLLALIKIKTGAALSLKDLDESRQILKDFYLSEGYLEMKIMNEKERGGIVSYNDSNTQANVQFNIYEGPRVIVREVEIRGNSFTKDRVIRRELTFLPGEVLTPDKVIESTLRLQSLGLFSRVDIHMSDTGSAIAERTVQVDVEEAIPGDVRVGIGANNERELTFRGYVAASYSNLNGTGRGLHLRVEPKYSTEPRISYLENRTTLSYLEPYVFNVRNRGRINLVRDQSFFDYIGNDAIIQEENSIGFLLEKDLSRTLKLTTTIYNFANQLQWNRRTKETIKTQNIAKVGPLLELDLRDNIANPTKGIYTFVNLEYSDPAIGSSQDISQTIHFVKTNASFSFYQQMFGKRDLIWANSLRAGYLANLSNASNSGVPSQEDFFLGGRATIRGFDANDLERIPNRIDLGVDSLANFRMTSDSHYYLVKSEFRIPVYRNFALGPLGFVIFYDGGAVILSQMELPDPYRDAAGFGIRIETPVGPLNLEIGWKLDRRLLQVGTPSDTRETPWAFHFSIGSF